MVWEKLGGDKHGELSEELDPWSRHCALVALVDEQILHIVHRRFYVIEHDQLWTCMDYELLLDLSQLTEIVHVCWIGVNLSNLYLSSTYSLFPLVCEIISSDVGQSVELVECILQSVRVCLDLASKEIWYSLADGFVDKALHALVKIRSGSFFFAWDVAPNLGYGGTHSKDGSDVCSCT